MIETQQNLREINSRLDSLSKKRPHIGDRDIQEWENLQANRARCEKDLEARSGVLAFLQKVDLEHLDAISNNSDANRVV